MSSLTTLLALLVVAPAPFQDAPTTQANATTTLSAEVKSEVLDQMTGIITRNAFAGGADFSKLPELLEGKKTLLEAADTNAKFVSTVNSVLSSFGFSHVQLMTPEAMRMRRERKMVGLGIRVQPEDRGLRIHDVFPGSAASDAGLEPGDLILEADGSKPTAATSLAGEEGAEIALKLEKSSGQTKDVKVKRRAFSTAIPESVKWPQEDVAVVKVPTFDVSYDSKNVAKIMEEASKAKFIVLDLRSNGGGAVFNLLHLSSFFFERGTKIGTFLGRSTVDRYVKETNDESKDLSKIAEWARDKVTVGRSASSGEPFKGKVAVLINGGTGSASEIVAMGLREVKNCPVIGTKSAGAVLASFIAPLKHGFALQYPITDYVSIKGVRLEGNGIKPDIEAPTPTRVNEGDKGLDAALDWYRSAQQSAYK